MVLNSRSKKNRKFIFILTDQFSMISFSAAVETMRMANDAAGEVLYEWGTYSTKGGIIKASSQMGFPTRAITDLEELPDAIFICGGIGVEKSWSPALSAWLNKMSKRRVVLGSISTGSYILAKSGLLNGYQCTIHWDRYTATADEFPEINFSLDMFHLDRDRYTCGGGTSVFDFFLEIIKQQHSKEITDQICDMLLLDRHRDKYDRQRVPLRRQIGTSQPKLTEVAELMQANIEEPLSPNELASYVCVSRRQLERLFQRYMKCTPTKYYLNLRLNAARRMLLLSDKPITDVAFSCGFRSATHFSKCYRELFNVPPSHDRRLREKV